MHNSIESIEDFYQSAKPYVELFDEFVRTHALAGRAAADHICYKCESATSFEDMRRMFEGNAMYLYQSIISKRRIAIVRLQSPIETVLGPILYVELSDQKPDGSQREGFDHIEAYPTAMSYDEMVHELEEREKVIRVERPHHTTHDIDMGNGFLFRCTQGLLIEKIKGSEMN